MLTEIFDASFTSTNPKSTSSSVSSVSVVIASLNIVETSVLREFQARKPVITAKPIKSRFGIPGTKPSASITKEVGSQAAERFTCRVICSDMFSEDDTRVTMIAVAIESKSDGICATSPSPMESKI